MRPGITVTVIDEMKNWNFLPKDGGVPEPQHPLASLAGVPKCPEAERKEDKANGPDWTAPLPWVGRGGNPGRVVSPTHPPGLHNELEGLRN